MSSVEMGAIDPISAYRNQLADLIRITESFKKNENLQGIDYLRAVYTIRENLSFLNFATLQAVMSEIMSSGRITDDDIAKQVQESEQEDATLTEGEKMARILRRLTTFSTIQMPDDDENGEP